MFHEMENVGPYSPAECYFWNGFTILLPKQLIHNYYYYPSFLNLDGNSFFLSPFFLRIWPDMGGLKGSARHSA